MSFINQYEKVRDYLFSEIIESEAKALRALFTQFLGDDTTDDTELYLIILESLQPDETSILKELIRKAKYLGIEKERDCRIYTIFTRWIS